VPFVYGSFAVGLTPSSLLVMFAVLAFLSNTGREIIKGISDITGDAIRQVRTLARSFGPRRASQVAALFYFLAVGASAIPVIWIGVSPLYLPFVLAADFGFVYSAAIVLLNPSSANARKAKTLSLIWMLLGLIAFVLGGLPF
ncbi:MAG: UbiA family prenyltransferase, partial [Candidatus Bathyarchaeia archaeon]